MKRLLFNWHRIILVLGALFLILFGTLSLIAMLNLPMTPKGDALFPRDIHLEHNAVVWVQSMPGNGGPPQYAASASAVDRYGYRFEGGGPLSGCRLQGIHAALPQWFPWPFLNKGLCVDQLPTLARGDRWTMLILTVRHIRDRSGYIDRTIIRAVHL